MPTSYFVDSEGRVLGEPVIGINEEKYREMFQALTGETAADGESVEE